MKQSNYLCTKELFCGSDIVRKFSFKAIGVKDSCAILAKFGNTLSMDFALTRGKSALFQEKDCFECLSPHKIEQ